MGWEEDSSCHVQTLHICVTLCVFEYDTEYTFIAPPNNQGRVYALVVLHGSLDTKCQTVCMVVANGFNGLGCLHIL